MAKYLVVVESPAKAKTINKFLGSNFSVKACFGAVRDLPKSQLGVDVDNNFEPKYVVLREERTRKALKEIKERAAKVDKVYIASDPDREGEAIAWHVAEILKNFKKTADIPSSRVVFNEITKENVKNAIKNPREIDFNLVDAQQARRVVDRLVGYKISPLLGWVVRKGLSAGRVQSVTTRMVVEREEEIRKFVPEEYWSIEANLKTIRDYTFTTRLHSRNGNSVAVGKEGQIASEADANQVLEAVKAGEFKVTSVVRKETRRRPSPPFITSSLQQDASRKLGMTPARTMAIAQQLYQGLDIGEGGQVGLITYMRTDSLRLSNEAIDSARSYIGSTFEPAMMPEKPNFYKNKKDAQDAHEAIRPSSAHYTPEKMAKFLDENQLKLYTLIWKRFIASQMNPAILDQTTIDIENGDYVFRATGSIMKFPGFTKLYEVSEEDKDPDGDKDKLLPEINEGEAATLNNLFPDQHFTKPPPRFSEASLVRAMEENGIGRPSTYAATIKTIIDRMYVEKEKGRLVPTELGETVNEWLITHFPDILNIDFTAKLEVMLDNVEEGSQEWHALVGEFNSPFEKDLKGTEERMVAELVGADPRCPECDSPAILKQSWFGMYMGCTKEDCKGVIRIQRTPPEPTDEICDRCQAPMVIRSGRYGKFIACSTYPKCDFVINLDKEGNKLPPKEPPKKTDEECPDCKKGMLLIRKSRRGEEFFGCEKYPKCRYTRPMPLELSCPKDDCDGDLDHLRMGRRRAIGCAKCEEKWFGQVDKDHACSACGNSWTLVRKPRGKPKVHACPKPTCAHEDEIPEEKEEEE
jgi:DNA topoisomerase-1